MLGDPMAGGSRNCGAVPIVTVRGRSEGECGGDGDGDSGGDGRPSGSGGGGGAESEWPLGRLPKSPL